MVCSWPQRFRDTVYLMKSAGWRVGGEYNLECFAWLEKMLIQNHDQKGRQENNFFFPISLVCIQRGIPLYPQRLRLNDYDKYLIQMLIKYLLPFLFEQLDSNYRDFSALSWQGGERQPTKTPFILISPLLRHSSPAFSPKWSFSLKITQPIISKHMGHA